MKPSADRAATARVLADIAAATRPVADARTAAAVERVLSSAAPSIHGPAGTSGRLIEEELCVELGISRAGWRHVAPCPCIHDPGCYIERDSLGDLLEADTEPCRVPDCPCEKPRREYAPWRVSPHLFEQGRLS